MIKNSAPFQNRSYICRLLLSPASRVWTQYSTTYGGMQKPFPFSQWFRSENSCARDLFLLSLATYKVHQFLLLRQNGVKVGEAGRKPSITTLGSAGEWGKGGYRQVTPLERCLPGLHIWTVLVPGMKHVLRLAAAQNENVEKQSMLYTMANNAEMFRAQCWLCVCVCVCVHAHAHRPAHQQSLQYHVFVLLNNSI